MKYNELSVSKNQSRKRVGRGISAGQGKTAGRGTKGQKSRTGHSKMPAGFMGGQRAIMQAIPKLKGFKSIHDKAQVIYTDNLNELSGKVDNFILADANIIDAKVTSAVGIIGTCAADFDADAIPTTPNKPCCAHAQCDK